MKVYGHNHSPWVQAVLLGLHQKGLSADFTSVPPAECFLKWGVWMPTARVEGKWQRESGDILESIGYPHIDMPRRMKIQRTWQGVLHRTDSVPRFVSGFANAGDPNPSAVTRLWRNFLRAFITLYMLTLIRFMVSRSGRMDPDDFADQYLPWEEELSQTETPFFGGDSPDATDLMLFGIIQCHCSIPVPTLETIKHDERLGRLRQWMGTMHEYFADYPYLYSGPHFEPKRTAPERAALPDRLAFYLGFLTMAALFPVTLPLIAIQAARAPRSR